MTEYQLISFLRASKKPQQAEPFLLSCLQLFTNDQWTSLEVDTWNQLALCEQMMGHSSAYVRASLKVASHSRASSDLRVSCMQRITDFALSNKGIASPPPSPPRLITGMVSSFTFLITTYLFEYFPLVCSDIKLIC